MDRPPDRQSEVNKYLWSIYACPRMSGKKKFLFAVLGVIILGFVVGFEGILRVAAIAIPIALFIGVRFWVGFEIGEGNGVLKGEAAERKRMLDEGYSLGYQESPQADDDAKRLRTCRNCGHIMDDD